MERLYKAKKKHSNEWVEGYVAKAKWYFDETEMFVILPTDLCIYPRCEFSEWHEIDEKTICQYTGLTDKNGNKIWENDLIEAKNDKHHFISQIEWDDWCKGFMFQDTKTTACGMDALSDSGCYRFDYEVIGNIFDNPELLGGK